MKKQKSPKLNPHIALVLAGSFIITITPLVTEFLKFLFTYDCPILWSVRECGLRRGLQNATYIIGLSSLWAAIGASLLILGMALLRLSSKKKA